MATMNCQQIEYQDQQIKRLFPQFRREHIVPPGEALWRGTIRPLPGSPRYNVAVWYRLGGRPRVWVREVILSGSRTRAPHLYNDDSLCLYYPGEWQWKDSESIAHTILFWTSQWLLFYEWWLDTNKWLGPEAPHSQTPVITRLRRAAL
jgi:hypothetical protein